MASTTIIADLKTVAAATPTAASAAAATAAAGPMMDLQGMYNLALLKAQELKTCLTQIKASSDAGDPVVTTVNGVLLSLV